MPRALPSRVRVTTLPAAPAPATLATLRRVAATGAQPLNDPSPDRITAAALAGGTPIGLAQASPDPRAAGTWRLETLSVLPQWRHKGVGCALVAETARTLREKSPPAHTLAVAPGAAPDLTRFLEAARFSPAEDGMWTRPVEEA